MAAEGTAGRAYMNTFEFDGEKYKLASKPQKEWGSDLISALSFRGNERVLDLGCGDGVLTEQLSNLVPDGTVLGIDASIGMIETAKMICKSNLVFVHMDINEIGFENEFDLIFSNAALHWVKDHKRLLKNVYKALKVQGEVLWDFGGFGNCIHFIDVVQEQIKREQYVKYFENYEWPWFMPSKKQYVELISGIGFAVYTIEEVNRDRYFSNASELIQWIDQPSFVPFIKCIPKELKETFRQEIIEEMLRRTQQSDGTYFETFRRIKIYAQK